VYRARQTELDREVAVKILSGTDDAFVQQFRQEAKALGKLGQHPNVVTVYDTGVTDKGQPYLILELCQSSAAKRLKDGPLKPAAACVAAAQVADGLGEAHENGIVHGDVRPGNILIGQTGRYVVTDFGLGPAGPTGSGDEADSTAGPYAAPEGTSRSTATAESDIYALGAVLFHMATGSAPSGDASACQEVLDGKELPDIGELVAEAMSPAAKDRPTAADLRDQLLALAAEYHNPEAESVLFGAAPALAGSTKTIADAVPVDGKEATSPPPPNLTTGPSWLVPPAPTASQGEQRAISVLEAEASSSGIGLGEQRVLPTRLEERPRRSIALVLAAVGLFVLLGGATYLLFNQGENQSIENEEAVNVEAVEGPETSLDPAGNEATNRTPGGAVGSLGSGSDEDATNTTISGFDDTAPTTATTEKTVATVPVVTLPNLVAYGANDAEAQLVALGFTVTRIDEPSTVAPVGEVIRQVPAGGIKLETGETVTLVVASAPVVNNITVPAVIVGQSEADAKATLTAAGFTNLGPTLTEPSATVPAGVVVRTTPAVGTEISDAALITIVVSGGPAPDCATVVGLTQAAASAPFAAVGMTVTADPTNHVTVPVGTVISCTATASAATLKISQGPIADLCAQAAGKPVASFEATLVAAGYSVTKTSGPSATATPGTIINCTVTGAAVALTFAELAAPQNCPAVVGMTEADARAAAITAGFADVSTTVQPSETVPSGVVISCTVTGAVAKLVVSSGPAAEIAMPNVVGQTEAAATTTLTGLGLVVQTSSTASAEPAGTVLSTNPVAGATVAAGGSVTIEISSGPALVVVPDVVGRRTNGATQIMENAGFVVTTRTEPAPDASQVGRVLRTNPVAGTEVAEGAQVRLIIGS
jgi:serine/threonine-protein kinase